MSGIVGRAIRAAEWAARRLRERAILAEGFSDVERHLWMLADSARAEAYESAIGAVVRPGSVVADVGAGTGLLSMMACRAGASKVYAIEETGIHELARRVITANGLSDRITIVHGSSTKVSLPERVDVVVSETIGTFVFSEGILPTLVDARRRLLKPGGTLIPERILIRLAPVETFEEGTGFWERPVCGFDYSAALAHVSADRPAACRRIGPANHLDGEQVLYDLDFTRSEREFDFRRWLVFTARREGTLHGFVGSWEAFLGPGITLRCAPGAPPVHWTPILFRLPGGLPVSRGSRIGLEFARQDHPGWRWSWSASLEPPDRG